ncbi:ATPase [Thermosphaera aggregans]|nr:ATPase [Thermosphaera aggregans]
MDPLATGIAYFAATLPLAGGILGSSRGMWYAASVGASVLAEEPTQFRNVLTLAALPMTQTFYGLIQMIYLILIYAPIRDGTVELSKALALLGLGFVGFLAEAISAWAQGVVCASGIAELPRTKGASFVNTVILAAYVELWGILGIVFTILGTTLIG